MKNEHQHIRLPLRDTLSFLFLVFLPSLKTVDNSFEKAVAQFFFFAQKADCPWVIAFQNTQFNIRITNKTSRLCK